MKYFVLLLIVIAIIIGIVMFKKYKSTSRVEVLWEKLIKSNDENDESENIQNLTNWLSENDGYLQIYGILNTGDKVNLIDFKGDITTLKNVTVTFNWADKSYTGSNWNPINKKNSFLFLRDK